MDLDLPANVLYGVATERWKYGRNPLHLENRLNSAWFLRRIYAHMGGRQPTWEHPTGYVYSEKDKKILLKAQEFMREVCALTEDEVDMALVSKSVTEAAKFSVKVKGQRFSPEVEKVFFERCKGKKRTLNALLTYCGKWGLMPENMTEITLVAGFEGGYRGELGKEFMKKLAENKRQCRDFLVQIMKMDGIGEDEPIAKLMERLA